MKKTIHLISGLPRAGSSLLCNILAQNPKSHVTSTNGTLQLLQIVKNNWQDIEPFKSQGLENTLPRMRRGLRGMFLGFYEQELDHDIIVFDKDRGWLNNIELVEEVLGCQVKIITCVRDVKDIVASFEKLNRINPLLRNSLYGTDVARLSIYSRSVDLLSETGVVGNCVNMLRDVFTKKQQDRLLIVPFENLTKRPGEIMFHLENALNLPHFDYKFTDMEQLVTEDDFVYGIPHLHSIGKDVKYVESTAIETLGQNICDEIDANYKDIRNIL